MHLLLLDKSINLVGLFTTVNQKFNRVAMHSTRLNLLQKQASEVGLPLHIINIPYPCTNAVYEKIMQNFIKKIHKDKIKQIAFGDLFLTDIRDYRIKKMQGSGIKPIFPCWGLDTKILANDIVNLGICAKIVCVDPKQLNKSFAGREYDINFINDLPNSVDKCGENGEFHSFVYNAPFFKNIIKIKQIETVERDGFVFTDFI